MTLPGYVVVEAFPFNGPDDPDAALLPVDITAFVNDNLQVPSSAWGRQTDMQAVDPGQFTITLNNQDHRFTPGNPTSPYYPGWRTGMRLRMRETVGVRTFTLADGNLLQPQVTIATAGLDQTVTVTAQDRIGRLQQGRRFISTLTEWVRYNATNLAAYWPLADVAGATQAEEVTGFGQVLSQEGRNLGQPATLSASIFTFGAVAGPRGDDGQYPQFNPALNVTSDAVQIGNRLAARSLGLTIAGTSYAVVVWARADATNQGSYQTVLLHDNAGFNSLQIGVTVVGSFQCWRLTATTAGGTAFVNGPVVKFNQWQMLGARLTIATGLAELWVDDTATANGSTGGGASGNLDIIVVEGDSPNSSAGHAQIYNGGDYTYAQFLAQHAAGMSGLGGQYTGARIRTVMQYAGINAGELDDIDPGVSQMGSARLAGRTAYDVASEAATTEQGLLHAYGRHLVFHDRARRYNR